MIEDNQNFLSNISQGSSITHSITIPSGTQQLKLMVYWHDKEGSVNASPALVNDLDIELFDNAGNSKFLEINCFDAVDSLTDRISPGLH